MLRNYKKKDTAMGRDISYRNNATLCVNRLEESVRVFSMGHISVFWDFINPVASNKSIEIFGSRVLISRKHSYVGLDLTKVKHFVWESIWLEEDGDGVYGFLFAFCRPSLVLQLECFADTESCQTWWLWIESHPSYYWWYKSFKVLNELASQRVKSNIWIWSSRPKLPKECAKWLDISLFLLRWPGTWRGAHAQMGRTTSTGGHPEKFYSWIVL